jgi:choline dehydrogenase
MGSDDGAAVGLDLRVRGVDRLSVVSTAVLPSAGTANPTFSMLCLAEEFAESILRSPG